MFLDKVSSPINLTFKGIQTHGSVYGVFLTLLILVTIAGYGVFALISLVNKTDQPQSNLVNKWFDNSGNITLAKDQMFHKFELRTRDDYTMVSYDPRLITYKAYLYNFVGMVIASYEYDFCKWNIDAKGNENLFVKEDFEQSACMRKYIDEKTKEEIILNEETEDTFPWPYLQYGIDTTKYGDLPTYIYVYGNECRNTTTISNCYPKEKINKILLSSSYSFIFLDNTVDVTNYTNPINPTRNILSGHIFDKQIGYNHLNIRPIILKSAENLIFETFKTTHSYVFYQNEKNTALQKDSPTKFVFAYWFKNNGNVYSRSYKRFPEKLAQIGGFFNFLMILGRILNFFSNKFQIIINTYNNFQKHELEMNSNEQAQKPRNLIEHTDNVLVNIEKNIETKGIQTGINARFRFICCEIFQKCSKNNKNYQLYYNLRSILISEEALIHTHLDVIRIKKTLDLSETKVSYLDIFQLKKTLEQDQDPKPREKTIPFRNK